jgi:Uma2 family endonuclease
MEFPNIADVETFIRWEEDQEERYEFADGLISLMPGASENHETIAMNVAGTLWQALGPGRVRGSSFKQVTKTSSRYPDVSVKSDRFEDPLGRFGKFPTLLVEVLSPSTYAVDRGPKSDEYRTIETLQEYVLIDSRKRWAQTIRRAGDDWIVSLPIVEGALEFQSVGVRMSFDEVYAGTNL